MSIQFVKGVIMDLRTSQGRKIQQLKLYLEKLAAIASMFSPYLKHCCGMLTSNIVVGC